MIHLGMLLKSPWSSNRRLPKFIRELSGSVALVFGLAALPLMLMTGAALDYQRATQVKSRLQAAVDAGALSAVAKTSLNASARLQLAKSTISANLGAMSNLVASNNITATESTTGGFSVSVIASASVPTTVMKLAHINTLTVSAKATAQNSVGTNSGKVCILALSPTLSPGFLANANAAVNAPTCEIHVASTGNPAATFNSGNVFNVTKLCVAGTQILNNAGSIPALQTGCSVASDPFAATLPAVTVGACTVSNQNYAGNVTISPGVYCGAFNFNGAGSTVTLNPGLYIFKGTNWNLNSGWRLNGSGVTFYFADQNSYVQINGGAIATLSAPTTGTYADILIFEPTGLPKTSFTVNGGSTHSFQGLVYLPSRNITFNDMANATSESMTIVVNSIILNTLTWNLQSSARVIPAAGSAASARLVQ